MAKVLVVETELSTQREILTILAANGHTLFREFVTELAAVNGGIADAFRAGVSLAIMNGTLLGDSGAKTVERMSAVGIQSIAYNVPNPRGMRANVIVENATSPSTLLIGIKSALVALAPRTPDQMV